MLANSLHGPKEKASVVLDSRSVGIFLWTLENLPVEYFLS